jgi:nucleotide-binding universal stress UspA family protein
MSDDALPEHIAAAEGRFASARRRAFIESIMGQLSGRPTDLLPFDTVKARLGLQSSSERGLRDIPLDQVVGSVGRYREFTRSFLPRDPHIRDRWKRIYAAAQGMAGLPPIEVYKVGDVYFVQDGNHRVSVAREMGAESIQAHVTEFVSPMPLTADTDIDELILKAETARFLQHTRLDELRPETRIGVTSPGYHEKLEEHIAVHGYFLGLEEQRDISWEEAVAHWYDRVYMPLVRIIRKHSILQDFPGRTETDLYLWIMEHRHFLAEQLGQDIDLTEAAKHFTETYSPRLGRAVGRVQQALSDVLTPDQLETAPAGQWRRERVEPRAGNQLFADILVWIDGSTSSWCAVDQAVAIAQREQGNLYGLHVAAAGTEAEQAESLSQELARRCAPTGVACRFISESGEAAHSLAERARWADLIVLGKRGDPSSSSSRLLESTFETAIHQTSRPVLATGEQCLPLRHALLAYDASPTSAEALSVAAHLARKWKLSLTVVTVSEGRRTSRETLDHAVRYLQEQGVTVQALFLRGRVSTSILRVAERSGCDLLIMGGTGYSPFVEWFVRSTVDHVLREAPYPVLICR